MHASMEEGQTTRHLTCRAWRPVGKRTRTRATETAKAPAEHHNLTQRCLALPCPVLGVSTRVDLGVVIVVGSIDDAEHAEDANRRSLLRLRLANKRAGGAGQLRGRQLRGLCETDARPNAGFTFTYCDTTPHGCGGGMKGRASVC